MTVTDTDMGYAAFVRMINTVGNQEMVVGILQGEIATYAYINEVGAPSVPIPARPWMSSTVDNNRQKYADKVAVIVAQQAHRGPVAIKRALLGAGLALRNDLIKAIVDWSDPENKESTKAGKHGVNNPLVDTGAMQRAITFEIRPRGPRAT
jgi:hypothetical protein